MTPARRRKLRRALCRISGTSGIPVATLKSWKVPLDVLRLEVITQKLVRLCQKHHITIQTPTRIEVVHEGAWLNTPERLLVVDYPSLLRKA